MSYYREFLIPFDGGRRLLLFTPADSNTFQWKPCYRSVLEVETRIVTSLDELTTFPKPKHGATLADFMPTEMGAASQAPILYAANDKNLIFLEANGGEVRRFAEGPGEMRPLALSPDGRLALVQARQPEHQDKAVRLLEISEGETRLLDVVGPEVISESVTIGTAEGWWLRMGGKFVRLELQTLEKSATHDVKISKRYGVLQLESSLDGSTALMQTGLASIQVLDLQSGGARALKLPFRGPEVMARSIGLDEQGERAFVYFSGEDVVAFDLDAPESVRIAAFQKGHAPPDWAMQMKCCPDAHLSSDGWIYRLVDTQLYWDRDEEFFDQPPVPIKPLAAKTVPIKPAEPIDHPIAKKLDALLEARRGKGVDPAANLRPGLSAAEIDEKLAGLPFEVPEEVRVLFRWRDGHIDAQAGLEDFFLFRDMALISLDESLETRSLHMKFDRRMKNFLPIAGLDGHFYAVRCKGRGQGRIYDISEGQEALFLSFESLIDTCLDWIADPTFDPESQAPEDEEIAWRHHNPGLLD